MEHKVFHKTLAILAQDCLISDSFSSHDPKVSWRKRLNVCWSVISYKWRTGLIFGLMLSNLINLSQCIIWSWGTNSFISALSKKETIFWAQSTFLFIHFKDLLRLLLNLYSGIRVILIQSAFFHICTVINRLDINSVYTVK